MNPAHDPELLVLSFMLVMARIGAFIAALPIFGDKKLPRQIKVGLVLALTGMWLGRVLETSAVVAELQAIADSNWLGYTCAMIREVVVGAMLGFTFSLFLAPFRIAGAYIGQEMGLTFATMASPTSSESTNVVSHLMEALSILALFCLDAHHVFLMTLDLSFERWPLGSWLPSIPVSLMINGVDQAHNWGLLIAAPVGICLFSTIVALSLLMRMVPQLNLFSIGLTVRIAAGLFTVWLFLPEMVSVFQRVFADMAEFAQQVLLT